MHKVHAFVKTIQGVDFTLCGRLNPHHRTRSWELVDCLPCKWKMQDMERERTKNG